MMSAIHITKQVLPAIFVGVLIGFVIMAAFLAGEETSESSSETVTFQSRKESVPPPPLNETDEYVNSPPPRSLEEELERITQKWIEAAHDIAQSSFQPTELPLDLRTKFKNKKVYANRRPMVFFHQRKAGGTSIRALLKDASEEHHLTYYIPCHQPKQCRIYMLPLDPGAKKPEYAIYGGHLHYSSAVNTLEYDLERNEDGVRYYTFQTQRNDYRTRTFDCLTNVRDPLERVVSSWNYRQIHNGAPPSGNMTASDWDRLLPVAYSEYGYGNNNEPARLFGGIFTEQDVNTLTSYSAARANATEPHSIVVAKELEMVLSRISTCVIYSQDRCEDSKKIAEHFFPWLDTIDCSVHLNRHQASWTDGGLQAGAVEVIRRHNLVEFHAYNFSMALFDQLLAMATGGNNNNNNNTNATIES